MNQDTKQKLKKLIQIYQGEASFSYKDLFTLVQQAQTGIESLMSKDNSVFFDFYLKYYQEQVEKVKKNFFENEEVEKLANGLLHRELTVLLDHVHHYQIWQRQKAKILKNFAEVQASPSASKIPSEDDGGKKNAPQSSNSTNNAGKEARQISALRQELQKILQENNQLRKVLQMQSQAQIQGQSQTPAFMQTPTITKAAQQADSHLLSSTSSASSSQLHQQNINFSLQKQPFYQISGDGEQEEVESLNSSFSNSGTKAELVQQQQKCQPIISSPALHNINSPAQSQNKQDLTNSQLQKQYLQYNQQMLQLDKNQYVISGQPLQQRSQIQATHVPKGGAQVESPVNNQHQLEETVKKLNQTIAELEEQKQEFQVKLHIMQQENNDMQESLQQEQQKLQQEQQRGQHELLQCQQELQQLRVEVQQANQQRSKVEATLARVQNEYQQTIGKDSERQVEHQQLQQNLEQLKRELETMRLQSAQEKQTILTEKERLLGQERATHQINQEKMTKELAKLQALLSEQQQKGEALSKDLQNQANQSQSALERERLALKQSKEEIEALLQQEHATHQEKLAKELAKLKEQLSRGEALSKDLQNQTNQSQSALEKERLALQQCKEEKGALQQQLLMQGKKLEEITVQSKGFAQQWSEEKETLMQKLLTQGKQLEGLAQQCMEEKNSLMQKLEQAAERERLAKELSEEKVKEIVVQQAQASRDAIARLEQERNSLNAQLQETNKKLLVKQNQLDQAKEQEQANTDKLKKLQQAIIDLKANHEKEKLKLKKQIEGLQNQLIEKSKQYNQDIKKQEDYRQLEKALQEKDKQLERMKTELDTCLIELDQERKKSPFWQKKAEELEAKYNKLMWETKHTAGSSGKNRESPVITNGQSNEGIQVTEEEIKGTTSSFGECQDLLSSGGGGGGNNSNKRSQQNQQQSTQSLQGGEEEVQTPSFQHGGTQKGSSSSGTGNGASGAQQISSSQISQAVATQTLYLQKKVQEQEVMLQQHKKDLDNLVLQLSELQKEKQQTEKLLQAEKKKSDYFLEEKDRAVKDNIKKIEVLSKENSELEKRLKAVSVGTGVGAGNNSTQTTDSGQGQSDNGGADKRRMQELQQEFFSTQDKLQNAEKTIAQLTNQVAIMEQERKKTTANVVGSNQERERKKFKPNLIVVSARFSDLREVGWQFLIGDFKKDYNSAVAVLGPAGSGKTSIIYSICEEMGAFQFERNFKENCFIEIYKKEKFLFFENRFGELFPATAQSSTTAASGSAAAMTVAVDQQSCVERAALNDFALRFTVASSDIIFLVFNEFSAPELQWMLCIRNVSMLLSQTVQRSKGQTSPQKIIVVHNYRDIHDRGILNDRIKKLEGLLGLQKKGGVYCCRYGLEHVFYQNLVCVTGQIDRFEQEDTHSNMRSTGYLQASIRGLKPSNNIFQNTLGQFLKSCLPFYVATTQTQQSLQQSLAQIQDMQELFQTKDKSIFMRLPGEYELKQSFQPTFALQCQYADVYQGLGLGQNPGQVQSQHLHNSKFSALIDLQHSKVLILFRFDFESIVSAEITNLSAGPDKKLEQLKLLKVTLRNLKKQEEFIEVLFESIQPLTTQTVNVDQRLVEVALQVAKEQQQ